MNHNIPSHYLYLNPLQDACYALKWSGILDGAKNFVGYFPGVIRTSVSMMYHLIIVHDKDNITVPLNDYLCWDIEKAQFKHVPAHVFEAEYDQEQPEKSDA